MKKSVIMALALVLLAGCARKNDSGKEMQKSYEAALEDSIKNVTFQIDSCNDVAKSLQDKIGTLLPEFRAVSKAREVEGYMIFQGWENRYPLTQTGLVARLSESRQLELVAVLKGGEFDCIRVSVPSQTAQTGVVPFDQALNYRQGGLNTVLFTGTQADTVARLIADNELNPVTVTFLNGGKPSGSWKMDNANAKMITMTYLLYSASRDHKRLEQESLKLGEKLKLLRQHQDGGKTGRQSEKEGE